MALFTHPILPGHVEELIDFGNGDEALAAVRRLQSEGVAALYNILRRKRFAYLADEVGMGKTFQAIGLAALLWHIEPRARILFVSPRALLQHQWKADYLGFFERNYRPRGMSGDDRAASLLLGTPVARPEACENLRDFARCLNDDEPRAFILRHTSFCRPVYLRRPETAQDIAAGWARTQEIMRDCGLPPPRPVPRTVSADDASDLFNERFAEGLNQRLRAWAGERGIDLLVVDEAQALRHCGNQTNRNFRRVFDGVVKRWLFLSATPLHNGPDTVKAVCDYADPDAVGNDDLSPDRLGALMKGFLIRRARTYRSDAGAELTKTEYREHRPEAIDGASGVPGLAMALVQKHLARMLKFKGNRYQVGFLTSFESLRRSTAYRAVRGDADGEAIASGASDDLLSHQSPDPKQRTQVQPDADAISGIGRRFTAAFPGRALPHPKLDGVAAELAKAAFERGEKVLVFMRRVAAVEEMCERLEQAYHDQLEARIREHWGDRNFDWRTGPPSLLSDAEDGSEGESAGTDGGERMDELPSMDPARQPSGFRLAVREGEWLHRYRRRFEGSGRNALFFEENWFLLLARLYGGDAREWARTVPETLWRQAAGGPEDRRFSPALRRAFILHRMLSGPVGVPGVSASVAQAWAQALELFHPSVKDPRAASGVFHRDEPLLCGEGFWEVLQREAPGWWPDLDTGLADALPEQLPDRIHRRQLAKNWIGQSIRLSDALIDLCYIDCGLPSTRAVGNPVEHVRALAEGFVRWLGSAAPSAGILRRSLADWVRERDLILETCFGRTGKAVSALAAAGSAGELNNQIPVIGIVGSDVNERALVQFKTPAYPRILVCTDVLKEGANLHTFCDRVMHYGIAWSAGDLEQRIGRVDRFRSLIERRLRRGGSDERPKLCISYPFLGQTLEHRQVDGVRTMMHVAEAVLDGLSTAGRNEHWTFSAVPDAALPATGKPLATPGRFVPTWDGVAGRPFLKVTEAELAARLNAFRTFAVRMTAVAEAQGLALRGNPAAFKQPFHLVGAGGLALAGRWEFRTGQRRYELVLTGTRSDGTPAREWSLVFADTPGNTDEERLTHLLRTVVQTCGHWREPILA